MIRVPTRRELYALFPAGGVGAELGVLQGENARDLFAIARPRLLHLVDHWQPYVAGKLDDSGQPIAFTVNGHDALAETAIRFAAELAQGLVVTHQADTIAWLAQQPASSLDWVYLDSDHGEPHVHRELCQAFRVVKAGGWICGHDYSAIFGGVVAAVDRFCMEHGQVIHVATDEDEVSIIASELERLPWLPRSAACNSVAIQVEK